MKKLSVLLLLPLAACIRFGAEPPAALLTLAPATAIPAGQTQSSAGTKSITVQVPVVPQELAVTRVPVQSSDTSIAYVKEAQWVEPPARLFARLLSDTLTARSGMVVLSPRQGFTDPGAQLSGELREFGIDATRSEAVVTFDATLQRVGATTFEKRRFTARVPVAAIDATTVGPAINQAANTVAAAVADWAR
ncbi:MULTISPECIES: ABC-type transport auxiliary lipoprotein family protein [unclassified Sphingomonas]|uniref:ABC-type transport auxiliary lipoprotein family protein n=1 Tax=unclassified Sphingomonas TaxID=196159 RepID=UPI0006F52D7C|nr:MULTISPECIES: ABC-type transport auxiliary lipoprotein family protein [unclassified Sphingomonas]KQM96723.1 ABC transporter [Sphingomonas sp. Leaf25]KQN39478.1 ABC transporter [Sphingomonas sp. Leaf42]KQT28754.1 ABC transporter [Sphingomonas sp. Leaf407]